MSQPSATPALPQRPEPNPEPPPMSFDEVVANYRAARRDVAVESAIVKRLDAEIAALREQLSDANTRMMNASARSDRLMKLVPEALRRTVAEELREQHGENA